MYVAYSFWGRDELNITFVSYLSTNTRRDHVVVHAELSHGGYRKVVWGEGGGGNPFSRLRYVRNAPPVGRLRVACDINMMET